VTVEHRPGPPGLPGLYEGIPLTSRTSQYAGVLPDRITIYRPATCGICRTEQEVDDQVRRTVIHQIAHHFGIDDNRLRELGWQDPDTVRPNARICRRQGRAQRAGRETLAMPTWSVGSRDLCQPRTEADGKPVTESNLSLRAPAQRAAVVIWSPNLGVFAVSAAGVLCAFPAWWTRYLDSVSAARLAQISLSLLFLELSGYGVNAVQ